MTGGLLTRMPKEDRLQEFGRELRRRREGLDVDAKVFAARIGISPQHLSQLETAYHKPGRGPVGPSDEVIDAISRALEWPVLHIRHTLGQIPDDEITYDTDPDFAVIREAYDGADAHNRQYLTQTARHVKAAQDAARAGAYGRRQE